LFNRGIIKPVTTLEQKETITPVSDFGEFGLIKLLTGTLKTNNGSTLKGVGDDAAVIGYSGDEAILASTDMYVEGVHFDLAYTPLLHLGYKCITASISDIYAMNGNAEQVLVSVALSSRFSVEALQEVYQGMRIACEKYKVDLVGGDTTSSKTGLVINITAIGRAKKDEVTYRNGAKPNDILCVSGDLGGAYVGLQVLEREKQVFLSNPDMQPELHDYSYVLQRQLRPEARKDVVEILAALHIKPTSMIDISDGLSSEILHLCDQSGTGCDLFEEKIPRDDNTYDTARSLNLDFTMCALNGGEDYELLFTISQADYEKIKNHPDFTLIGYMTEKESGANLITTSGNRYPLQAQGWKHF